MFEHHADVIDADYVLTELGGWSSVDQHGHRKITINVGEKGIAWRKLRVRDPRSRVDAMGQRQRSCQGR